MSKYIKSQSNSHCDELYQKLTLMYQIGQDLGVFLEMLNFQKFRVCPLLEK